MSCGKLHEPGGFHLHPPGTEHSRDEGEPHDAPAGAGTAPEKAPGQPSRFRAAAAGAWRQHGWMVKPFSVPPLVDGSAFLTHAAAGDHLTALLAAVAEGLAAETATEVANHKRKRSDRVRTRTRVQVTVATLYQMIAAGWTPTGWEDIVQWAALALGLGLGANHVYETGRARKGARERREPMPAAFSPIPIPPPPPPDPRLTAFITRFCQPGGALAGAAVRNFRELPHGFMLETWFAATDDLGVAHVENLQIPIAKLYDTTRDEVTVEHIPGNRSENCCQVVVLKTPAFTARQRREERAANRWDGLSTWNPDTGNIDLGLFVDHLIAHYQIHKPGSGAMMGEFAGVPGSGKTGALHVAAAEAGIAKLCSRCHRAGNKYSPGLCDECDMHRVMAVWVGDAQEQGMSVWNGRADLTGWGVEGCLELLEFADQVYEARGPLLSDMEWWDTDPDGRPRRNTGKGFFDLEIGLPLIDITLDEWPLLVTHPDPEIRDRAQQLILRAVTLWRKRGLKLKIAAQTLDLTMIGLRELREIMAFFNVVGLRLDPASSSMGALGGDPRKLPPDNPGAGYINGPDRRDSTEFTVKFCPEVNRDGERGVDIRHLAGQIQQTPIEYDSATQSVFESWGIPRRMVFTRWIGPVAQTAAAAAAEHAERETPRDAPQETPQPPVAAWDGVLDALHADAVLTALDERGGPVAFHELMRITDINVGPLDAILAVLTASRQVVQINDKEYKKAA